MEWVQHIPLAIVGLLFVVFVFFSVRAVVQMEKGFRHYEEEEERQRKKGQVDHSRWWG